MRLIRKRTLQKAIIAICTYDDVQELIPEDVTDAFLYADIHSLYAIIYGLLCTTFLPLYSQLVDHQ